MQKPIFRTVNAHMHAGHYLRALRLTGKTCLDFCWKLYQGYAKYQQIKQTKSKASHAHAREVEDEHSEKIPLRSPILCGPPFKRHEYHKTKLVDTVNVWWPSYSNCPIADYM
ncbi:hypothetical protein BGZ60DRAFT_54695 [Tricladium varicosporioides]|nr:hypothetical protein BGZ60DRAFT_54695 [Hymenoscyphus varicosporioides]